MKKATAITAATLGLSAMLPASAIAQLSDSWQFEASLYGYLPIISLKTMLPSGNTVDASISRSDLLDHLKMMFLGAAAVQKGSWGAFTDVMYMDLGGANSKTRLHFAYAFLRRVL